MKAIIQHQYGTPDQLALEEVDRPTQGDDQVLLRVHAASVNPLESHQISGTPYLVRLQAGLRTPKQQVLGTDVAGAVEAVGAKVTKFEVGDEVFGAAPGSLAEYAVAREARLARKPANVSFEQAASVPIAALTALQALRDKGKVGQGQRVLINGAAGGVGTFAVQIAKVLGAEVTAVCSTRNVEMVRSIGADHVVDYTREDFTATTDERYDVMLDMIGNRRLSECRRVLTPKGIYVIVGGPDKGKVLGPMTAMFKALISFAFSKRKAKPMLAKLTDADLRVLAEMLTAGTVKPVIDRTYDLADTAEAMRYLMEGHARGKVVITV